MKTLRHIFSLLIGVILLVSCEKENDGEFVDYQVAIPVTQNLADFRASVSIESAQNIRQAGKIYTYEDYIFVNDKLEGIHIIDNSNPLNPIKMKFLKIPANEDIAVKDNILYADSGVDLVVFDISNIQSISLISRLENVFPSYNNITPQGADFIDYTNFDPSVEVIVDFTIETRRELVTVELLNNASSDNSNVGQGGSLARFNITGEHLYAVDNSSINIFDISNLNSPTDLGEEPIGWQIETIFNQGDYLYIGSAAGMFIYSIENPATPNYQSNISHIVGCDPVVVQDDLAYVTIRGGNDCGQELSILEVIDVSDKQNPMILAQYEMDEPYGLGVKDNLVFVCDRGTGLRVFDASASPTLEEIQVFESVTTLDVIPQDDKLIMVSEVALTQYTYSDAGLEILSVFRLE